MSDGLGQTNLQTPVIVQKGKRLPQYIAALSGTNDMEVLQ